MRVLDLVRRVVPTLRIGSIHAEKRIEIKRKSALVTKELMNSGIAEVVFKQYKNSSRHPQYGYPWSSGWNGDLNYTVDDFDYLIELEKNPIRQFAFPRVYVRLINKTSDAEYPGDRYLIPLATDARSSIRLNESQLEILNELVNRIILK